MEQELEAGLVVTMVENFDYRTLLLCMQAERFALLRVSFIDSVVTIALYLFLLFFL